jgi:hypothetical protein
MKGQVRWRRHRAVSRPPSIPRWMLATWMIAQAATCVRVLCVDHDALSGQDLIAGLALGVLNGGHARRWSGWGMHPWRPR